MYIGALPLENKRYYFDGYGLCCLAGVFVICFAGTRYILLNYVQFARLVLSVQ